MKDRPIFFSAELLRASLEGRKTQTRRVVKCPRLQFGGSVEDSQNDPRHWMTGYDGDDLDVELPLSRLACPYGQLGDRLWVRESFRCAGAHESDGYPVFYRTGATGMEDAICKWKPSIHMPRWASRITLEVTAVRVERLQNITEVDCENELGVEPYSLHDDAFPRYMQLWNRLNAKRGYSAESNPWVWVIEFRRVDEQRAAA